MPPITPSDVPVNQFIPEFISRRPFYVDDDKAQSETDYLEHQRLQTVPQDTLSQAKWYDRGRKVGPAATKFRKGACENCGAMTHKTSECLSRPRKQGAKWTGRDIQADEAVGEVSLGWAAKRDRWNGYDARDYSAVVREYEELEALKQAAAGAEAQLKRIENVQPGGHAEAEAEPTDAGRGKRTLTGNLRIREDTAKYLLNLNLDSVRYDPKTRSMADVIPTAVKNKTSGDDVSSALADENFIRSSGDAAEMQRAQRYAWETQEKGARGEKKLHLQANPTEGEFLQKKHTEEVEARREARRKTLLEKYGGSEHLQSAPFRAAENERYVEYDESGGVKGAVKETASSRYKEDVLINNHTTVWGSWWSRFRWGYACCHSTAKNSYCTGEEGKRAFEEAERLRGGDIRLLLEDTPAPTEPDEEAPPRAAPGADGNRASRETPDDKAPPAKDNRTNKRTLLEMRDGVVAEDELEAFKRNRAATEDPMAALLGKDELVH